MSDKAKVIAERVVAQLRRLRRGRPLEGGGTFVEAGAFDGVANSNSRALRDLLGDKWRGVLVEPVPELASRCAANRGDSVVLVCALGNPDKPAEERGEFVAFDGAEGELSGFGKQGGTVVPEVEIRRLSDVVLQHMSEAEKADGVTIVDVLFLDVEGAELEVLRGSNFGKVQFRVMVVEHNNDRARREEIRTVLRERGYVRFFDGEYDDFYQRRSDAETIAKRPYFIRNPKVASMSVTAAIPEDWRLPTNRHQHYRRGDSIIDKDMAANGGRRVFFVFGFVRNPYDRAVSLYHWLRARRGDSEGRCDAYCAGLAELANVVGCSEFWQRIDLRAARRESVMFRSQADFLDGDVDYVGRYETLGSDWAYVATQIGLDGVTLPEVNFSAKRRHWKEELDGNARLKVLEYYKVDFERFGYDI
jgi:FkbM family methyltransferase